MLTELELSAALRLADVVFTFLAAQRSILQSISIPTTRRPFQMKWFVCLRGYLFLPQCFFDILLFSVDRSDKGFSCRAYAVPTLVLCVFPVVWLCLDRVYANHRRSHNNKCAVNRVDQHRKYMDDGRLAFNVKQG